MQLLRFLTPALIAATALCCFAGAAQAATAQPDAGHGFTVSLAAELAVCGSGITCSATASSWCPATR
jgi:hypothetical protein